MISVGVDIDTLAAGFRQHMAAATAEVAPDSTGSAGYSS
jgi:hypothetical protein